jgi:hypothetical protein
MSQSGKYNSGAVNVANRYIRGGQNGIRFDPNGDSSDNYEVVMEEDGSMSFQFYGRFRYNSGTSKMQFSVDGGLNWADMGRSAIIKSATAPSDPTDGETMWVDTTTNTVKLWYEGDWVLLHTMSIVLSYLLLEDDASFLLLEDDVSKLAMG